MYPVSSSRCRTSTTNSSQVRAPKTKEPSADYIKFPTLPESDPYIPGTVSCQLYQSTSRLSEPAKSSLLDTTYQPKMPPPTLLPFPSEVTAQHPSDYEQYLPELPPQSLRVVNRDPPAPASTVTLVSSRSCVCPSMAQHTMKVENEKKQRKIQSQKEIESPYSSYFYSKELNDVCQNHTTTHTDKEILNANRRDTTRKPESIPEDPRQKSIGPSTEKKWQRRWCVKHLMYDLCAVNQRNIPNYIFSHPKNNSNTLESERISASDANAPTEPVTLPPVEAKEETAEATPDKRRTDTNRFVDSVDYHCTSRFLNNQHRIFRSGSGLRRPLQDEQKKASERLLEEARRSEIQWRSGVEKVTQELEIIEKNLQAVSKTSSCGGMQRQDMARNKEAVKAVQRKGSLIPVRKTSGPFTAKESLTPTSIATAFIEPAAGRYCEKLESVYGLARANACKTGNIQGEELKKVIRLSSIEQEAEIEAVAVVESSTDSLQVAKAEGTTSRTRVIAASLKVLENQAEADSKWESVDLSDDDGWENMIDDNSGDWEYLENNDSYSVLPIHIKTVDT